MEKQSYLSKSRYLLLFLFALIVGSGSAWADGKALPYSYGFEDNNLATDGWTMTDCVSGTAISSDAKKTGSNGFSFKWSSSNEQLLISPELTGTGSGVQFTFYSKNSSSSFDEEFYIGYSTASTDKADFTFGSKITISKSNTQWLCYEETFPANTKYVAIKHVSDGMYQYIDDISFSVPSAYSKPTGLTLNSATQNSATIGWTEKGTATKWQISYSTTSGAPDAGTIVDANSNPFTVTGLTAGTTYYASVRACSNDYSEHGDWSAEINFTPGVITVNDGTSSVSYVPFYGYYMSSGVKSQFIIPASDLTGIQQSSINKLFFYHQSESVDWGAAKFKVYLKEVDKTAFTSTTFDSWDSMEEVYSGSLSVSGNKMVITFDNAFVYEGGNLMIGINETTTGTSSSYNYNWLGKTASGYASLYNYSTTTNYTTSVPKVSIAYSPIANFVAKPKNVVQSSYTSTSVTLGWDNADNIDSWEISYQETQGNPADGTIVTSTTNSKMLEGLTAETTYYVYVRAKKGEYYSAWTAALPITPTAAIDLTIYDKKNTNSYLPAWGQTSYSTKTYTQFIIPSSALTAVKKGKIKKLTFYSSDASKTLKSYSVYVTETDASTFTSTDASTMSGTVVYNGVLTISSNKMVITFASPFDYAGGNLQIGFSQNTQETSVATTWYGENQSTNVGRRTYRGGSTKEYVQFLPKTTINYVPYVPTNPVLQITDPESNVLEESPAAYNYGLTENAETRDFTIQNTGAGTLTVKSITATGGYLLKIGDAEPAANIGSTTIGTSEATPVTLKVVQPAGTSEGVITITTDVDGNDTDETFVINVSGVVRQEDRIYQVFNSTSIPSGWGATGTWSYSATNGASTSAWNITTATARLYTPKATVAAGEKFIFEAKGTYPTDASYQHLRLEYSANGTDWTAIGDEVTLTSDWKMFTITTPNNFVEGNYYVALHGSQVAIRKFYGGEEVLEPVIALSPTTKAFGLVTNEEAQTQVFTVSNSGKADLKNLTVAVPTGFTITKENDTEWVNTQTVAANDGENDGTQTFKVTMSNAVGVYAGNITIDGVYGVGNTAIEQKTIAVSGVVRDADCLFADFEASSSASRMPTEWTNTNWAFDWGKYAQAAYSGTSTLITEKLGISAGQKLIFLANKSYNDATLGVFYCATNSDNEADWTEVTPAAISTAATNTDVYYAISVGDGDGLIPVGDYFIKFVGTKSIKLDNISYFKKPLAGKFEMYDYDANAEAPYLGTEITANQTKNLGNNVTETQTIKYVVKNAGTAAMTVTASMNAQANGVSIAPTDPTNIAAGQTAVFTITMAYDAENLGAKSGVATISAGALGEYTVTVSGTTRDGSKVFVDFASGEAIPSTWTNTNTAWATGGYGEDKYIYATSEDAGAPSRMITSRMVVAAGGENLSVKAKKTTDDGTLVIYWAATKDGFTTENKSDISTQLNTESYAAVNVAIPEGMEYVAFDGYKVSINELYGLANAPTMKVRETADGANLTTGLTHDFGMTAAADSKTLYVVNEAAGTLAGVDATLTGTGFTLTKTNLEATGGNFSVAIDTSVKGYREATLTVSGTDQDNFVINLKGFVTGEEGKMLVNFNDNQLPANWTNATTNPWEFVDGKAHTKDGNTGNALLTTCKLTVAANEVLAIKAKGETNSAELRVHVYQNDTEITAKKMTFDSQVQASTSDYTTLYFTGLAAGDYKLVFDGWKVYIDEIAGFTVNANDPKISVAEFAVPDPVEIASGTQHDFGWSKTNQFTYYYISNSGTGTLTISNISAPAGYTVTTADNAMTVAAGADPLQLTVTLNSGEIGAKSGNIVLTTDGGNFTIPVKGFIFGDRNLVDFTNASQYAGWTGVNVTDDVAALSSTAVQTTKLQADAAEKLYVEIKGSDAYATKSLSYSYSSDNGANWSAATALVESTYGNVADQVFTISDIADPDNESTVLIRFTGSNLGINRIYGFEAVPTPVMALDKTADYNFGMQTAAAEYVIAVSNNGTGDLENLAATLTTGTDYTVSVAETTVAPGENTTITVTQKASTEYASHSDVLTISADGVNDVVINLSGKTRDGSKWYVDFANTTASDFFTSTNWSFNSGYAAVAATESPLISKTLTVAAGGETIKFDAKYSYNTGTLKVRYSVNGTWSDYSDIALTDSWAQKELNIPNENSEAASVMVEFLGCYANIDNIYGASPSEATPVINFDENSTPVILNGTFDVTLNRTFVAGWNTICLPFAVTDIEGVFGEGVKIYEFDSKNGDNLRFTSVDETEAGTPYLIKMPAAKSDAIVMNKVNISTTTAGSVVKDGITLYGSFAPMAAGSLDGYYGVNSENQIAPANGDTTMKGFRAYFSGSVAGARISVFDETTGITTVYGADKLFGNDNRVYNLKGQHVENAKKGIYIVNGKKVVIK